MIDRAENNTRQMAEDNVKADKEIRASQKDKVTAGDVMAELGQRDLSGRKTMRMGQLLSYGKGGQETLSRRDQLSTGVESHHTQQANTQRLASFKNDVRFGKRSDFDQRLIEMSSEQASRDQQLCQQPSRLGQSVGHRLGQALSPGQQQHRAANLCTGGWNFYS